MGKIPKCLKSKMPEFVKRETFTVNRVKKNSLATRYSLLVTPKTGMTLVELMVSLVILMIVLGAVYSILSMQQTRATQVSRTTILQTDAQVAFTLLKWDLMMTGLAYPYSYPYSDNVVISENSTGPNGEDAITIRGVGLGFEIAQTHWGYVLDIIPAGTMTINVRRWDDQKVDFVAGDQIILINHFRFRIGTELVVQTVEPFNFTLPNNEVIPANHLNFADPFAMDINNAFCAFAWEPTIYDPGIKFSVNNNQLLRGNELLLDNVEDLQFAYGIDDDGDNLVETWDNTRHQNPGLGRKWAIRFTMVVTSEGMPGYTYPDNTVTVEDHIYTLTPQQRRMRRAFMSGVIYPQNLEPGG